MEHFKKPAPQRAFAKALQQRGEAEKMREAVKKAIREEAIQVGKQIDSFS